MKWISLLTILSFALIAGCERDETTAAPPADQVTSEAMPVTTAPAKPRTAQGPRIVFLGDSLTAGLGLDADQAFPALLATMLAEEHLPVHVVNAGVSGDTTAGGLRRLDWLLQQDPDIVVVGLGANDGLRGVELKASEENLRAIVRKSRDAGAHVLLLGMLIPPNYGPEYTTQFRELYQRIATDMSVPLVPFILQGVGGEASLNQADGIHPTADGQRIVARNILPHLRPIVKAHSQPATGPAAR